MRNELLNKEKGNCRSESRVSRDEEPPKVIKIVTERFLAEFTLNEVNVLEMTIRYQ